MLKALFSIWIKSVLFLGNLSLAWQIYQTHWIESFWRNADPNFNEISFFYEWLLFHTKIVLIHQNNRRNRKKIIRSHQFDMKEIKQITSTCDIVFQSTQLVFSFLSFNLKATEWDRHKRNYILIDCLIDRLKLDYILSNRFVQSAIPEQNSQKWARSLRMCHNSTGIFITVMINQILRTARQTRRISWTQCNCELMVRAMDLPWMGSMCAFERWTRVCIEITTSKQISKLNIEPKLWFFYTRLGLRTITKNHQLYGSIR